MATPDQPSYRKVAFDELKDLPDGTKVEYTDIYTYMFEVSCLGKEIWLAHKEDTIYLLEREAFFVSETAKKRGYLIAKVKVFGTLLKKDGSYGHLGMYSYEIVADKMEMLEEM